MGSINTALINKIKKPTSSCPPIPTNDLVKSPTKITAELLLKVNACEYPIAFQLFPVTQYRKNSLNTQTNGAARNAHDPNRRKSTDNIAANKPGNTPTMSAMKTIPEYASHGGNPA